MTKILSHNLVDYAVKSQLTKADSIRDSSRGMYALISNSCRKLSSLADDSGRVV
jgi:hypothetical protein